MCLRGAKMVLEFQASDSADSVGTSDRRGVSDQNVIDVNVPPSGVRTLPPTLSGLPGQTLW